MNSPIAPCDATDMSEIKCLLVQDAGRDTTRARRVRPVTSNTKKDTDDLPMPTVTNLASNNSHTASARDGLEHGKGCDPPQSTDDRKLEESGEESCSRDTTTLRELILRLGDVDDAQRDRLARAQISIEEEVARSVLFLTHVAGSETHEIQIWPAEFAVCA